MEKYVMYNDHYTDYVVTFSGRVFHAFKMYEVKPFFNNSGYLYVRLKVEPNKTIFVGIHRLVATFFVPNPHPDICTTVNHIDGDKLNNYATNLEWVSQGENNRHANQMGLHKPPSADKIVFTKYSEDTIRHACQLLQDGVSPIEVGKRTGINIRTIYDIKRGKIRKDIVSEYTFPSYQYHRIAGYEPSLRESAEKMILEGKKPAEICKELDIPDMYGHVKNWKYRLMKAQRLD